VRRVVEANLSRQDPGTALLLSTACAVWPTRPGAPRSTVRGVRGVLRIRTRRAARTAP